MVEDGASSTPTLPPLMRCVLIHPFRSRSHPPNVTDSWKRLLVTIQREVMRHHEFLNKPI